MKRVSSIDIARGLVMIIMALDHTRDLLHVDALTQNPTNLATTTPLLFFTRWITHLCAPSFVFLSGTSAWLSIARQREGGRDGSAGGSGGSAGGNGSVGAIRSFLLTRGLWLILLEFTLVNFALWWDIHFRILMFQVIAAIGFGFIALAFLYRLSPGWIAGIGLLIIFGHDALPPSLLPANPTGRLIVSTFFAPGLFPVTPNFSILISYPIIPWLGILLTGFAAGRLFERPAAERKKLLMRMGIGSLLLFIVLRFVNVYGDPAPWSVQRNAIFTLLSFLNVTKYPPSLQYTLVMLGLIFLFMVLVEGRDNAFLRVLSVYGKVPLFYYLIHWYVLHSILFAMVYLQGFHTNELLFGPFQLGRPAKGSGLPLWGVYGVWLGVVSALYPLCRWYAAYKASHKKKVWLRYL